MPLINPRGPYQTPIGPRYAADCPICYTSVLGITLSQVHTRKSCGCLRKRKTQGNSITINHKETGGDLTIIRPTSSS